MTGSRDCGKLAVVNVGFLRETNAPANRVCLKNSLQPRQVFTVPGIVFRRGIRRREESPAQARPIEVLGIIEFRDSKRASGKEFVTEARFNGAAPMV
jgi:hypothetical protein